MGVHMPVEQLPGQSGTAKLHNAACSPDLLAENLQGHSSRHADTASAERKEIHSSGDHTACSTSSEQQTRPTKRDPCRVPDLYAHSVEHTHEHQETLRSISASRNSMFPCLPSSHGKQARDILGVHRRSASYSSLNKLGGRSRPCCKLTRRCNVQEAQLIMHYLT